MNQSRETFFHAAHFHCCGLSQIREAAPTTYGTNVQVVRGLMGAHFARLTDHESLKFRRLRLQSLLFLWFKGASAHVTCNISKLSISRADYLSPSVVYEATPENCFLA